MKPLFLGTIFFYLLLWSVGGVSVVGMAQGAFLHGLSAIWFHMGT